MIQKKKITIVAVSCLGAFILFNVLLFLFPVEKKYIYKDKERGEEFIYSGKTYSAVFAGSGLIGCFNSENLGRNNFYNLFFPYNGSCTGVALIALSEKIPDTLFIETNYISKGFNVGLIANLFRPAAYQSKFFLPCLLEKNKPLALAKEILKDDQPRTKNLAKLPGPFFQQSLDTLRKEYNRQIDSITFYNIIMKLKRYIDYISSRNCTVVFFEMPVDSEFLNCPKMQWERKRLKSAFSDKKFIWAGDRCATLYSTSDGIHLLDESLEQYIQFFNSDLARY